MGTQDWRDKARYLDFQGRRIAYWTGGKDGARPLLLVHGFPTCAWDWSRVWETLGAGHRLIACDMLGFGLSDKPRGGFETNGISKGYAIHWQADIQAALLQHLGVGEFDALVHDYGVSVGQEMLHRQHSATGFSGLGQCIFLNGGIFPDQHRPVMMQKIGVSRAGFLVGMLMKRKSFGKSFSQVFGPDTRPSEAELDEYWQFISAQGGHRITHKLLHYIADRRTHKAAWEAALVAAQDRIGLINGALDPVSGRHAYDKWREVLPHARHHLIETVGHYPQVEAPQEVAAKTLEWLGG